MDLWLFAIMEPTVLMSTSLIYWYLLPNHTTKSSGEASDVWADCAHCWQPPPPSAETNAQLHLLALWELATSYNDFALSSYMEIKSQLLLCLRLVHLLLSWRIILISYTCYRACSDCFFLNYTAKNNFIFWFRCNGEWCSWNIPGEQKMKSEQPAGYKN